MLDQTIIDHRKVRRLAKIDPIVDTGRELGRADPFERTRTVFVLEPFRKSM